MYFQSGNSDNTENNKINPPAEQFKPKEESFKKDFLYITQTYNLKTEYKDLGKQGNFFFTQISLDTKPSYVRMHVRLFSIPFFPKGEVIFRYVLEEVNQLRLLKTQRRCAG